MTSTEPEEPHLKILYHHKHIYDFFIKTGELVNFYPELRKKIVDAYKVENPHYHYNDRCVSCVVEMLVEVYIWFEKRINNI